MILGEASPIEILNYLERQPTDNVAALLVIADASLKRRIAAEEYAKAHPPQVEVARRGRPPKPKETAPETTGPAPVPDSLPHEDSGPQS